MAEWSIAAVLKTVVLRGTGGSNPSLSADEVVNLGFATSFFCLLSNIPLCFLFFYQKGVENEQK